MPLPPMVPVVTRSQQPYNKLPFLCANKSYFAVTTVAAISYVYFLLELAWVSAFVPHHNLAKTRHKNCHLFLWRDMMGGHEKSSWRSNVTAIGASVAGLIRRQKKQDVLNDLFDDEDEDVDEIIGLDFCEIEDAFGSPAWEKCIDSDLPKERRLMRVENRIPLDVSTKSQVWDKIQNVKQNQSCLGSVDLYERTWSSPSSSSDFTVAQFNTLAEGLSAGATSKPPFSTAAGNRKEITEYGGFASVPHPEAVFDFEQRKWRLLEVLLTGSENGDRTPFDIIALEEVDRFYGFFSPILRIFGYRGLFLPKTNSPCARMGWYSDGCCLFWRDSDFELVSEDRHSYNVGTQVFLLVTLRHKPTSRLLVIAVTHLKAQRSDVNEAIRCCQVKELLDAVKKEQHKYSDAAVLVVGDFNADPPRQVEASESAIDCVGKEGLDSAYSLDDESFYTTNKIRGTQLTRRIIDYIFYDKKYLNWVAALDVPPEEELEPSKLPGLRYPSDHLLIAAKFRFTMPGAP